MFGILSSIVLLLLSQATGCSDSGVANLEQGEVEISPGKWLSVKGLATVPQADVTKTGDPHLLSAADAAQQFVGRVPVSTLDKETYRLEFGWNGKAVKWKGREEIPITLREHEGTLYMVVFNREEAERKKSRFIFLKLGNKGTSFETIAPRDFPRQIATQNMWIGTRFVKTGDVLVDQWEMLRKLDINGPAFGRRFTAKMWYQIETGTEQDDIGTVDTKFLEEYVTRYKPTALPTLIREAPPP